MLKIDAKYRFPSNSPMVDWKDVKYAKGTNSAHLNKYVFPAQVAEGWMPNQAWTERTGAVVVEYGRR